MVNNIWVAAADNQIDLIEEYLSSGGFSPNSKDPNGYTPIHAAASYGHTDLLKLLISKGGDINITDNEGDSPLHHVEDLAIAKLMVEEFHADWRLKNHEGQTPADYIEEDDEFPDLVQYLRSLSHGGSGESGEVGKSSSLLENLPAAGEVDGQTIRYTYEEEQPEIDDEKRKRLEAIVNSENPEEALRELIKDAVHEQFGANGEESSKRRRDV